MPNSAILSPAKPVVEKSQVTTPSKPEVVSEKKEDEHQDMSQDVTDAKATPTKPIIQNPHSSLEKNFKKINIHDSEERPGKRMKLKETSNQLIEPKKPE